MMDKSQGNTPLSVFLEHIGTPQFDTRESYLSFCQKLIDGYKASDVSAVETPTFARHLANINQGGDMVIKTSWGGVDIIKHEHPLVEKYLVVQAGRFLAYEKHEQKIETLQVKEGHGVLVFRPEGSTTLCAEALAPGYTRTLHPHQEHTIVALSDLLVFESSKDPKGMDQDLIFIYEPA